MRPPKYFSRYRIPSFSSSRSRVSSSGAFGPLIRCRRRATLTSVSACSTAGVPFASEPLSTVVPPGSFHTVRIRGTPLEAGLLIVRGCYIRLAGCTSREFLLPVWDNEEEAKRQKATMLDTSRERTKASGLGAFGRETPGESGGEEGLKFLECTVVPEMPLLWMRSTSLTHGALMLYDGEV